MLFLFFSSPHIAVQVDLQRKVHDLELELAQVKFQLVETDCELQARHFASIVVQPAGARSASQRLIPLQHRFPQGTRQRLSAASASPGEESSGSKRRVNLPGWLKR